MSNVQVKRDNLDSLQPKLNSVMQVSQNSCGSAVWFTEERDHNWFSVWFLFGLMRFISVWHIGLDSWHLDIVHRHWLISQISAESVFRHLCVAVCPRCCPVSLVWSSDLVNNVVFVCTVRKILIQYWNFWAISVLVAQWARPLNRTVPGGLPAWGLSPAWVQIQVFSARLD